MPYQDDYITSLPTDPHAAIAKIIGDLHEDIGKGMDCTDDDWFDARDLVLAVIERFGLKLSVNLDISNVRTIEELLDNLYENTKSKLQLRESESRRKSYVLLLGSSDFHYEFTDADLKRMQELINELRDLIAESKQINDEYKRRLLLKLEKLQTELHKRMSDIQHIYGLIGDAGVLSGKLGRDSKPLVDRIRELLQIGWRSQAGAEQLPASARPALLSDQSETGGEK